MSESPKKSRSRRLLLAALIAVPLVVLLSGGFLHAQHLMHHGYTPPDQQAINIEHMHAMLARVGTSPEQTTRIDGFLRAAIGEMQSAHDGLAGAHQQLAQLLLAPQVDQEQLELLRAGQVDALDTASRHLVAAMQGAIQVLTPGQRAMLLALHHPHGG